MILNKKIKENLENFVQINLELKKCGWILIKYLLNFGNKWMCYKLDQIFELWNEIGYY